MNKERTLNDAATTNRREQADQLRMDNRAKNDAQTLEKRERADATREEQRRINDANTDSRRKKNDSNPFRTTVIVLAVLAVIAAGVYLYLNYI